MANLTLRKYVALYLPTSRRQADSLIVEGKVKIDEAIVKAPSTLVNECSKVVVNEMRLLPKFIEPAVWIYHKPRGLVTTHKDPRGRKTVFDALPKELKRVISVGRLDINTEGLLIITNDAGFARHMELPVNEFVRTYRVRAFGRLDMATCERLVENEIDIEGVVYKNVKIELEKSNKSNSWLRISIKEGKNREVRKVVAYLGLKVSRIIRVSYGPFKLDNMKPGEIRAVNRYYLKRLWNKFQLI